MGTFNLNGKYRHHIIRPTLDTFQNKISFYMIRMTESAGTVEYTNCISSDGYDSPNECPEYHTKQSNGEAWINLELWGMKSTPSLPSLPGLLWIGEVAPDRVLAMGLMELNCNYAKLNWLKLTVFSI